MEDTNRLLDNQFLKLIWINPGWAAHAVPSVPGFFSKTLGTL
jgi:hypothetical protein